MPDIDSSPYNYEMLSWTLDPGDVLIHHALAVHGAAGNRTNDQRRRALAVRYTGDDARYDPRPDTFMEMERVRKYIPAPRIDAGAPFGPPLFPQVWPR
jgi:ectoine hydroxylase-related dioxygenase (phytanoyl-CoA dioxygenase family)